MNLAIIFDLDGVITDTAHLHYKAWSITSKKMGLKLTHSLNNQLKGLSRMDSLEKLISFSNKSLSFSEAEKKMLAIEKNTYYQELISTLTTEDVLPGIKNLLQRLKKENIPVGLASASHNAPNIVRRLELDSYFDHIVNPAHVISGKPAPDLFLLAANKLDVSPRHCIGIEDAQSGIQAIKAAGMYAIGVGDGLYLEDADFIVSTTEELTFDLVVSLWKNYLSS